MSKCVAIVLFMFTASGCASHATKTVNNLDKSKPQYESVDCESAMKSAEQQDNIKLSRIFLTPAVVILSGGILAAPALAANAGLDTLDHLTASDISIACGGQGKSLNEISKEVVRGAAFGLATGGTSSNVQPSR